MKITEKKNDIFQATFSIFKLLSFSFKFFNKIRKHSLNNSNLNLFTDFINVNYHFNKIYSNLILYLA